MQRLQTIYSGVINNTESTAAETLGISRLKHESEALLKMIGQLTYRAELREKIQRRGSQ